MDRDHLRIGFIRRGYSRSGGAESYLKRLAQGLRARGHEAHLCTTEDWPNDSSFDQITRVSANTAIDFADKIEARRRTLACDVIMSLERVWQCDVLRAGDGVHRAWLERRVQNAGILRRMRMAWNRKHESILRLEESLYGRRGAGRVIANSQMVKREITTFYGYPTDQIDVVPNGVPLEQFHFTPEERAHRRAALNLMADEIALLFVGSGWERKGLNHAIAAVEKLRNPKLRLLIAGRGDARKYASSCARFLGEVADVSALYCAADIFVLPTLYDPFSNACLEALASGLPVITTAANGFSEAIESGVHGTILSTPKAERVAEAIAFWSSAERRSAARPVIIERAAQFDIARNVTQTLQILLQAAARAASTSGKMRKT